MYVCIYIYVCMWAQAQYVCTLTPYTLYLPQRRMTHWSPLEVWRCQTVGYWDPRGLSLCCFCVRFRGVWKHVSLYTLKPWLYTCIHILLLCMYVYMALTCIETGCFWRHCPTCHHLRHRNAALLWKLQTLPMLCCPQTSQKPTDQ